MEMYLNKIKLTGLVLGQLPPKENCPPPPFRKLTLTQTKTQTPTGGQFSSEAIARITKEVTCKYTKYADRFSRQGGFPAWAMSNRSFQNFGKLYVRYLCHLFSNKVAVVQSLIYNNVYIRIPMMIPKCRCQDF